MKLIKQKPTTDFARNKAFLSDGNITTNIEKYTSILNKAIGVEEGIQKTLSSLSEEKDENKIVETLRMIVEYYDLKDFMKKNIR